jgi:ABC-2 type transport system permease protein
MNITHELRAISSIAYRDFAKLLRDRPRMFASLIFPVIFIGALGGSLQSNWGEKIGYNLLTFIFTGVFGQTMFQSTASGLISLVEDRANDFSQELFIAPVSRYTIILGKILGETLVSSFQGVAIIIFGLLIGVPISIQQLIASIPVALVASFLGGSFGLLIMSQMGNERSANQIFPFLLFPQFFLAGVFSPIKELPLVLFVLSRIAPMTYAVDFGRGIYYWGAPEYKDVVLHHPLTNLTIIAVFFVVFVSVGTFFFVRNEKNR